MEKEELLKLRKGWGGGGAGCGGVEVRGSGFHLGCVGKGVEGKGREKTMPSCHRFTHSRLPPCLPCLRLFKNPREEERVRKKKGSRIHLLS